MKVYYILMGIFLVLSCQNKDEKLSTPKQNQTIIVNDEVVRFWKCFNEKDSTKRHQQLCAYVLDTANNPAVHQMYNMTLSDTNLFVRRIDKFSNYYKDIQQQSLGMANKEYAKIGEYYQAFLNIYPNAHRPNIIFTVGALTVGGTVTKDGLVIGTEFYGKHSADTSAMSHLMVLSPKDFEPLTFHEHMHYEQLKNAEEMGRDYLFDESKPPTLLQMALNEGAADFVSGLITHWYDDRPNYIYGKKMENELWQKFKTEMNDGQTIRNWMFDYQIKKTYPSDLGYFMGAKICESYYKNAKDKAKAIKDILSITDAEAFLKQSKYEEKFK